tara:strand:- start:886 stop:1296 length:411 start_codon:yes stop_codon:yes gene_type:complete
MEIFDKNLMKYDKSNFYITKPFDWDSIKNSEIIKMDIKHFNFGVDFLYFHVVKKTNDDILCAPKGDATNFYSFHSAYFNKGESTLRRITENGDVEFNLEIMTQVSLIKWLYFKINNMLINLKYRLVNLKEKFLGQW